MIKRHMHILQNPRHFLGRPGMRSAFCGMSFPSDRENRRAAGSYTDFDRSGERQAALLRFRATPVRR